MSVIGEGRVHLVEVSRPFHDLARLLAVIWEGVEILGWLIQEAVRRIELPLDLTYGVLVSTDELLYLFQHVDVLSLIFARVACIPHAWVEPPVLLIDDKLFVHQ